MRSLLVVGFLVCLTIAGCGGGGGGSDGDSGTPVTNPTPVTNSAPVANAGPDQNVATGTTVILNGSGSSDADSNLLTYFWSFTSRPAGSTATLSNATAVNPTFTAGVDGSYVLSLIVRDGTVDSAADTVTVFAATDNSAPVANAGSDQNVITGSTVTLNGSGSSDANGDSLTFAWSFVSRPAGSTATLSNAAIVNPTFTADVAGNYVLSLIVRDGTVDSAADSMTVNAVPAAANSPPVANAGPDDYVITGNPVTLDGSGSSDANGDPLTYAWSFVSRPPGSNAALSNATTVSPTFTADIEGNYVLRLIVDDGTESSTEDTVQINSIADYSSLFLKAPQILIYRNGDTIQEGSRFSLEIKNISTIPFVCTRAELHNGLDVENFTEDQAFLGGDQIVPDEVMGLTFILLRDVPAGDFQFRYYLTRPDTDEVFIIFHQYSEAAQ
jgi:hypothetical protein